MKSISKIYLESADELANVLMKGIMVEDFTGACYHRTKDGGFVMEDWEGIQYVIPSIEFEKDVYFYYEGK